MVSKTAVTLAVGVAGIFVGYCFYFDQKRRNDPDFKKKLRERRKIKRESQIAKSKIPNHKDHRLIQKFFMEQVELGEALLTQGDLDGSLDCFANAVRVCSHPHQLLLMFQNSLPPQAYYLLLQKVPTIGQKLHPQTLISEYDVE